MKKVFIILGLAICLGASAYFFVFNKNNDDYTFRYDKINKGDVTVVVTATGTLSAVTTVQVGSQVSGLITKLYADFNSIVKAGEIIAQIDPTFLEQSVKDAQASLEKAKAQYDDSKRNFDRTKSLFEKQLASQMDNDAALTTMESNAASLKSAEAQLERAKINLTYATIYAPINGVVINRQVDVGQTVNAGFSAPNIFTIANDLSKMQVQATVDETDIGRIYLGQEATFTVDAYPDDKFTGRVSQIRLAPVIVQNVVNYTVIIDVPNGDLKLMPGMTASVKVLVAKKTGVLKVPNIALRFQPPTDIIDSVKLNELREAFRSRGMAMMEKGTGKDTVKNQDAEKGKPNQYIAQQKNVTDNRTRPSQNQKPVQPGSNSPVNGMNPMGNNQGQMHFSDADREKFKKIRDSIQAAHGGNLSREEVMREMQKVFAGNRSGSIKPQKPIQTQKPVETKNVTTAGKLPTNFEIINMFPQYQKNSSGPVEVVGRGRIWILNSKGKLEPVFIRTGLNDGQSTEIISDNVTEGQQIVIGAFSNSAQANAAAQNPFTGQNRNAQQGPVEGEGKLMKNEISTNGNLIEIEHLSKVYQLGDIEVHALRGVSLHVKRSEFVAIMGASGSGKSTFMNILGCLDKPSKGKYILEGTEVGKLTRDELALIRNRKIGFVFQGFNLLSRTSALENVELPLFYTTISNKLRKEKAIHALEIVGLAERVHHYPNQLSGGQQQRVAIARSLVNDPSIILADEPTGNLDSRTSVEVMEIFQKLNDAGITVLLVTHEPDIAGFAKRHIIFRDGRIKTDSLNDSRKIASEVIKTLPSIDEEEL